MCFSFHLSFFCDKSTCTSAKPSAPLQRPQPVLTPLPPAVPQLQAHLIWWATRRNVQICGRACSRAAVNVAQEPPCFCIWFPSSTTSHDSASRGAEVATFRPPSLSAIAHSFVNTGQRFSLRVSPAVCLQACIFNFTDLIPADLSLPRFQSPITSAGVFTFWILHLPGLKSKPSVCVTADKPGDRFFSPSPSVAVRRLGVWPIRGAVSPKSRKHFWDLKQPICFWCKGLQLLLAESHKAASLSLPHLVSELHRPLHWAGEGW